MEKLWRYRGGLEGFTSAMAGEISRSCGVSAELARLLWLRGVRSAADGRLFLDAALRSLEPPERWPGMAEAASLLVREIRKGGRLAIWGDYDVDGITGTALALEVLHHHGHDALWHIPERQGEGYGMNIAGVEDLHARGATVLLTIDCGISDAAAIARARELGMTVVVTDHHLPPEQLPPAHVVCDPKVGGGPCQDLAGVGVIFYVMAALNNLLAQSGGRKMDMRAVLDLVALGTLADLVELQGQNRILVKNGLRVLADARRPGIAELKAVSGYPPSTPLVSGQVVFSLAPRINAAGRMASARSALELLRTADFDEARALAETLNAYNAQRRQEEDAICQEAMAAAEAHAADPAFVIAGGGWNQGVIGIVASRIVERFNKPVLVLCQDGESLKGSGRSIEGFDLHAGLAQCAGDLLGFGGHRMAAGIRVLPEKLDGFRAHFLSVVREALGTDPVPPVQRLDGDLDFRAASDFTFLKELEMLQPFGAGNPEPVFLSPPVLVRRVRHFGAQNSHALLELTDEQNGITLKAKAWRQADRFGAELEGQRLRIAYSPCIDMYNGVASVDVKIRDWRQDGGKSPVVCSKEAGK